MSERVSTLGDSNIYVAFNQLINEGSEKEKTNKGTY